MGFIKHRAGAVLSLAAVILALTAGSGQAHGRKRLRMPRDFVAWSRVADCESGGWRILGSLYPDSLGITRTNYVAFGGRPLPPGPVTPAEIVAQIRVADQFVRAYHMSIPDQGYCGAW